jgi:hypothetical protein
MEVISGIFLIAAFVAGVYLFYRVLAAGLGLAVRLLRVPQRALFAIGLALMGFGLVSLGLSALADACASDVTTPFLMATASLLLAPAFARSLSEKKTRRCVQLPALLGLLAWPFVSFLAIGDREALAARAMTIGDLRAIVSAETAYASENGGFFGDLECLQRPGECIPGYGPERPAFLTPDLAADSRLGYARRFHPGPKAPAEEIRARKLASSSLVAFAFTAVPAPRTRGRCESFCTDSTGRICFMADGSEPPVADGLCGRDCPSFPP